MKIQDLVKLNLDELEAELAKGSFSKSFLDSLLKAKKSGKSRRGSVKLIECAIAALDDKQYVQTKSKLDVEDELGITTVTGSYVVASSVRSLSFGFAGNKIAGEKVDPEWTDFKQNDKLLASLIERGLVIKK